MSTLWNEYFQLEDHELTRLSRRLSAWLLTVFSRPSLNVSRKIAAPVTKEIENASLSIGEDFDQVGAFGSGGAMMKKGDIAMGGVVWRTGPNRVRSRHSLGCIGSARGWSRSIFLASSSWLRGLASQFDHQRRCGCNRFDVTTIALTNVLVKRFMQWN